MSNERTPSDGEIYSKIRQHFLRPLAAARWWGRLTENKRYELKRLLRRDDFTAAFDALLDIPGLWVDGMRLGVTKDVMGLKCDEVSHLLEIIRLRSTNMVQEMLRGLDHVRVFWAGLFRDEKHDMQKVDHATVKALELRAPGTSTSDIMTLFRQLKTGAIFGAFGMDRRMEIWARLQAWEGLVPTLRTFFEDFKYIEVCAKCVKQLVKVPLRKTLYTAMVRSFSETSQRRGKCIVEEAESVFSFRSSNVQDRVAIHYREIFLYVMRHLRELCAGSTKLEPRLKDRQIQGKKSGESTLYGLAILAEKLGFQSTEISELKKRYSSYAKVPLQSRPLVPEFVVEGPGECMERRSSRPFDLAYEHSKDFLFLDNMNSTERSQRNSIQPVFVRKSVYLTFFGRLVCDRDSGQPLNSTPPAEGSTRSTASRLEPSSPPFLQSRLDDPEEITPDDQDQGQTEMSVEHRRTGTDHVPQWQDYVEQLGDPDDMWDRSRRSLSVPENRGWDVTKVVEELVEDQNKRDWETSRAPSIIGSSFYSDAPLRDDLLEDSPFERQDRRERAPLTEEDRDPPETQDPHPRDFCTAVACAYEEDEPAQERFRFFYRDGHVWVTMEELFFDRSLAASVRLIAHKHASEGRYLFDTHLCSLHPSECYEAAMAHGSHVILVIPGGNVSIDECLAETTLKLDDTTRLRKDRTKKRLAAENVFQERHIQKKKVL